MRWRKASGALTTRRLGGKREFPQQELVVKIETESLVKIRGFSRDRPKVEGTDHPSASGEPLLVATYVLVNHVNESKIFCCAFELAVVHLDG